MSKIKTRSTDRPVYERTASRGHSDLARQEFSVNSGGIRGMDTTQQELREVGKGLADVVVQRLDRSRPVNQDVDPLDERGALVEALLALGVGEEPTVRGAIARHAYLNGPNAPQPVSDPNLPPPRRR